MFISIGDMRSGALGVDKVDVSTKRGASTAIEIVNNAIQNVFRQISPQNLTTLFLSRKRFF
ncbi:MAG: hypothetical protein LBI42_04265 [Chitinispirillales bacterium]|jgi:flagellin|nr:hypothetical protein [Chitinispirillales bacterium]